MSCPVMCLKQDHPVKISIYVSFADTRRIHSRTIHFPHPMEI